MDIEKILADIKAKKLAAIRYEREGHSRYRDCVTVGRNGRLIFERYCYGEAASLVFQLRSSGVQPDGALGWKYDKSDYSGKEEAPARLTGYAGEALLFDDKPARWLPARELKKLPKLGLGGFNMLFLRLFSR